MGEEEAGEGSGWSVRPLGTTLGSEESTISSRREAAASITLTRSHAENQILHPQVTFRVLHAHSWRGGPGGDFRTWWVPCKLNMHVGWEGSGPLRLGVHGYTKCNQVLLAGVFVGTEPFCICTVVVMGVDIYDEIV